MILGIDASRNLSWGAIAHIAGILNHFDPKRNEIKFIHIWTHKTLAELIKKRSCLKVHTPPEMNKGLITKILWQAISLPKLLRSNQCNLLFTSDAGSFCRFNPNIVLSQDLLPFEPGEAARLGWTLRRLRVFALKYVQASTMRNSVANIFLTEYAANLISSHLKLDVPSTVIRHGIDDSFHNHPVVFQEKQSLFQKHQIKCVYVSNVDEYKHQWHVVEAVAYLRQQGFNIALNLIGESRGRADQRLKRVIKKYDHGGAFVNLTGHLSRNDLLAALKDMDIFIFASSCESLPITLLEGMALGFPIAASSKGPMPEILGDNASFFDPEMPEDIANSIKTLITNKKISKRNALAVKQKSQSYRWQICADKTFSYLSRLGQICE